MTTENLPVPQGLEEDSVAVSILAAFVREIVAAGLGTWAEPGTDIRRIEDPSAPILIIGPVPAEPVNSIGLTPYIAQMDAASGLDIRAVQFRIRTKGKNPKPGLILTDRLSDLFHGRDKFPLRDGDVSPLVWRNSVAVLGETAGGNFEITNNYYLYIENRFTQEAYYG